MDKLSQHGGFDPALESSMREELLAEFSETVEELDFGACQRPDGSVYGTSGQCRKGTPISIGTGEGMPAIAKKAKERGLKQADVKSVADAVREKYGAKVVKKGRPLESAVRRLNERLDDGGAKPKSVPVKKEAQKPAPKKAKGEGTEAVDAKIRSMQKGLAHVRKLKEANAKNPDAVRLYGAVEKDLARDIKKLARAGSETKAKIAAGRKPVGLDSGKGVVVNKKLLGQKTEVLQQILRDRSINPAQRRKIEEELGGRGVTPTQQRKVAPRKAPKAAAEPAKFDIPKGRKGYDVNAAYEQGGKVLGKGAMGEARRVPGPPPAIVKKGKIGENEAAAIKKLEGTGVTPTFYGAQISGKAKRVSGGLGGHVAEANGLLAMSPMEGSPLMRSFYTMPAKERTQMFDEYVAARKAIHTRGVAHNDMHAGNFFYDPKTKKSGLVDFGLAQVSPRAALVEAMGLGGKRQGDWQAARIVSGVDTPGPRFRRFSENRAAVEKELKEKFGITRLPEIRTKPEKLEMMLEGLSDKNAELLIKRLYDGV